MQTVFKKFIKYVGLNVLGMLALSCYILADTFFVSYSMGSTGIAALNIAIPVYSFVNATGLLLGVGGGTIFCFSKGAKDKSSGNNIFMHCVVAGLLIGIMLALVGIFFAQPLSKLLGARQDTLEYCASYIRVILCFSPAFILNNVAIGFIRNDGAPNVAMRGMVIGSLCNIFLDYIFVVVLGGGMVGAAVATGLAPLISMLSMLGFFVKKKNTFQFVRVRVRLSKLRKICGVGITPFILEFAFGVVLIVFNTRILQFEGTLGVAAFAIVANLALIVNSLFVGVSQGMQPLFSDYYGGQDTKSMKKTLMLGCTTSLILFSICYTLLNVFWHPIITAFNLQRVEKIYQLARQGFLLYYLGFLFAGVNIVLSQYCSAIGREKSGFVLALLHGGVFILPLLYLLSAFYGMSGVWMSFLFAEILTLIVAAMLIFRRGNNLRNVL